MFRRWMIVLGVLLLLCGGFFAWQFQKLEDYESQWLAAWNDWNLCLDRNQGNDASCNDLDAQRFERLMELVSDNLASVAYLAAGLVLVMLVSAVGRWIWLGGQRR